MRRRASVLQESCGSQYERASANRPLLVALAVTWNPPIQRVTGHCRPAPCLSRPPPPRYPGCPLCPCNCGSRRFQFHPSSEPVPGPRPAECTRRWVRWFSRTVVTSGPPNGTRRRDRTRRGFRIPGILRIQSDEAEWFLAMIDLADRVFMAQSSSSISFATRTNIPRFRPSRPAPTISFCQTASASFLVSISAIVASKPHI